MSDAIGVLVKLKKMCEQCSCSFFDFREDGKEVCPLEHFNSVRICQDIPCDLTEEGIRKQIEIVEEWTEKHKNTLINLMLKVFKNVKKETLTEICPLFYDSEHKCNFVKGHAPEGQLTICIECKDKYWNQEIDYTLVEK